MIIDRVRDSNGMVSMNLTGWEKTLIIIVVLILAAALAVLHVFSADTAKDVLMVVLGALLGLGAGGVVGFARGSAAGEKRACQSQQKETK